jgi:hypothetical protein
MLAGCHRDVNDFSWKAAGRRKIQLTAPGGRGSISAISQILRFWRRHLRERSTPMLLKSPGRGTKAAALGVIFFIFLSLF